MKYILNHGNDYVTDGNAAQITGAMYKDVATFVDLPWKEQEDFKLIFAEDDGTPIDSMCLHYDKGKWSLKLPQDRVLKKTRLGWMKKALDEYQRPLGIPLDLGKNLENYWKVLKMSRAVSQWPMPPATLAEKNEAGEMSVILSKNWEKFVGGTYHNMLHTFIIMVDNALEKDSPENQIYTMELSVPGPWLHSRDSITFRKDGFGWKFEGFNGVFLKKTKLWNREDCPVDVTVRKARNLLRELDERRWQYALLLNWSMEYEYMDIVCGK